MKWVNVDSIAFPRHGAMFTVSAESEPELFRVLEHFQPVESARTSERISELAEMLQSIVVEARPELNGCRVAALHFDVSRWLWLVHVDHPSLPERHVGEMAQEFPLRPRDESRSGAEVSSEKPVEFREFL